MRFAYSPGHLEFASRVFLSATGMDRKDPHRGVNVDLVVTHSHAQAYKTGSGVCSHRGEDNKGNNEDLTEVG